MTKDELITKQQLEIEQYKLQLTQNTDIRLRILGNFYNIGQPLNDNCLQFNKEQIKWCFKVVELAEEINGI